jgi:hypothetical protein
VKQQEMQFNAPPYSLDLAPSDFQLFTKLKKHLKSQLSSCDAEVKSAVRKWFQNQNISFFNICHRSFTFNSNKSPTWCNSFSVYYPDVCLELDMFRAFSRPSSGDQWLQWQPLVLTSYRGDNRAVFVVGSTCHCSHRAPDDGGKNARNMSSCKQTSG